YRVFDATFTKNAAFCDAALNSESVFGCNWILHSKFCMKCRNSLNLTACFEMESCTNCSSSYFCHNCEGLTDCLFCFNVKSKRYAVGNMEVGKEEYLRIKKLVLEEITDKLQKQGKLNLDIYSICGKNAKK
ncbi:MAG: hypothetical protein ABIH99_04505, partial [Candidatus Micrarchaeota archaeon]